MVNPSYIDIDEFWSFPWSFPQKVKLFDGRRRATKRLLPMLEHASYNRSYARFTSCKLYLSLLIYVLYLSLLIYVPPCQSVSFWNPLTANAASVDTLLGGGLHRFTAICMSSTRYDGLYTTVPFIRLVTLGPFKTDTKEKSAAQREEKLHEYNLREMQF